MLGLTGILRSTSIFLPHVEVNPLTSRREESGLPLVRGWPGRYAIRRIPGRWRGRFDSLPQAGMPVPGSEGLPGDPIGCAAAHRDFPHQSTAAQGFDETQFEGIESSARLL